MRQDGMRDLRPRWGRRAAGRGDPSHLPTAGQEPKSEGWGVPGVTEWNKVTLEPRRPGVRVAPVRSAMGELDMEATTEGDPGTIWSTLSP